MLASAFCLPPGERFRRLLLERLVADQSF